MNVAVLGASPKKERYSNQAVNLLKEYGHEVIPVNPVHDEIEGIKAVKSLGEIRISIDTLSVYVGPKQISSLIPDILNLKPKRVILNPGTESEELKQTLNQNNIPFVEGCTLVMLRTNQF